VIRSTKQALWLAVGSAALGGLFYLWWGQLVVGTFAACVGGNPAAGVDCRHPFQLYAAMLFSAIAVFLLLVAAIRAARSQSGRVA
jgi:prolipoprotein diacylglyceryltransferase